MYIAVSSLSKSIVDAHILYVNCVCVSFYLLPYQSHVIGPFSMSRLQLMDSDHVITYPQHITVCNSTALNLCIRESHMKKHIWWGQKS